MLTPLVVLGLDAAVGEPPARWHPVVWFGRASRAAERRTYRPTVLAGAVQLGQLGPDIPAVVGEKCAQAFVEDTPLAGVIAHEAFGGSAARARLPRCGIEVGAAGTERILEGSGTDQLDLAAAGAASLALLACRAPRFAGDAGDLGRPVAAADRARQ